MLGSEKLWDINIDKKTRNDDERFEAEQTLDRVGDLEYEKMFIKQKNTNTKERGIMKALKDEQAEDLLALEKKFE